jgi:lipoyl(octanoyl) transferase
METSLQASLDVKDLGRRHYEPVLELQRELVRKRQAGVIPDTLLLVEHEPVYTLGTSATEQDVLMPPPERVKRGIKVIRTGRGGLATYHGPGQLVGYPILDLNTRRQGPAWYVSRLEQVLKETLALYGIHATTDPDNRGVWVGDRKIAAIGVRIVRRVTMHGFALNVTTELGPYAGIIPCGIRDRGVTSMKELAQRVEMADVKEQVVKTFCEVFRYEHAEIVNA